MPANQLNLYKSPRKQICLLLASSFFVIAGIFLLQSTFASVLLAWLCILVFSIGILTALLQLLERQPQLIISEVGLSDRTAHPAFINWATMQEAHPLQETGQPAVSLVVAEDFASSTMGNATGAADGRRELLLSLVALPVNAGQLANFLQSILTHAPEARAEAVRSALPGFQESIKRRPFQKPNLARTVSGRDFKALK